MKDLIDKLEALNTDIGGRVQKSKDDDRYKDVLVSLRDSFEGFRLAGEQSKEQSKKFTEILSGFAGLFERLDIVKDRIAEMMAVSQEPDDNEELTRLLDGSAEVKKMIARVHMSILKQKPISLGPVEASLSDISTKLNRLISNPVKIPDINLDGIYERLDLMGKPEGKKEFHFEVIRDKNLLITDVYATEI